MESRYRYWWIGALGLFLVVFFSYLYIEGERNDNLEQNSYEDDRVTIEITFAAGDASWNRAVVYVADMFMEENPDIEVVLSDTSVTVQSDLYSDYLKKQVAVDGLGDIVEVRNKDFFYGTDVLIPLTERLTGLVNCNRSMDGNVYILPETYGTQGIVYNKELFEKYDLHEPETYDEFIEICSVLSEYNVTPIIVGGGDSWHLGFWMNHFYRSDVLMKNMNWAQDCSNGNVSWTDDEPRKMFRDLKFLYDSGYINENYMLVKDSETAVYMAEETAAMLYSGPWMVQSIQALNENISLGWFYLPNENGEKCIFLDKSSGWGITKECSQSPEKYEAAQKFLEFFFSPEIFAEICTEINGIPSTQTLLKLEENSFLKEVQKELNECDIDTDKQIGDADTPDNFIRVLYDRLPLFLEGELSEEEFLTGLDQTWKDYANEE